MPGEIVVRAALESDARYAQAASRLIETCAAENEIAQRSVALLKQKILGQRAAIALEQERLLGFGFWSEWEAGAFVSHSGLVLEPAARGRGIGRRLKLVLFESSRRRFPGATLMSLTTSRQVTAFNRSLGFREVPLEQLTADPKFWQGCKGCRNYADVRARGERCCCLGMILKPDRVG